MLTSATQPAAATILAGACPLMFLTKCSVTDLSAARARQRPARRPGVGCQAPQLVSAPTGTSVWRNDGCLARARSAVDTKARLAARHRSLAQMHVCATHALRPRRRTILGARGANLALARAPSGPEGGPSWARKARAFCMREMFPKGPI